jgi:hypothetical protein
VTGALTAITRNNSNVVNGVTVGGTAYKLAAIRDDDFATLDASKISSTKKDVTLYLDAYGYATYIKDAGSSSNFMIVGDSYQTLVNGKLVATLTGWDMKGVEVSINVSTSDASAAVYGSVIKYETISNKNYDYAVVSGAYTTGNKGYLDVKAAEIKAGDTKITANTNDQYTIASGVKTIFVDFDDDNTVKSVYVKNGVANIAADEIYKAAPNAVARAQMYLNKDGGVEAIVVKTTSSDAVSDKVLYVESVKSDAVVDGVRTYTYHVWVNGAEEDYTSTDIVTAGRFATYAQQANGNYKMSDVTKTASATSSFKLTLTKANIDTVNKNLIYGISAANATKVDGTAGAPNLTNLNTSGAVFADLTDHGYASMKDIFDSLDIDNNDQIKLTIVMNDKSSADDNGKVSAIAVTGITKIA